MEFVGHYHCRLIKRSDIWLWVSKSIAKKSTKYTWIEIYGLNSTEIIQSREKEKRSIHTDDDDDNDDDPRTYIKSNSTIIISVCLFSYHSSFIESSELSLLCASLFSSSLFTRCFSLSLSVSLFIVQCTVDVYSTKCSNQTVISITLRKFVRVFILN